MWVRIYPPGSRKGNRHWLARGQDVHGRGFERVLRAAADERAARRGAAACLAALNGDPPDPAPPVVAEPRTFRAAAERYIAWRHPSEADIGRIARLVAVLGALPVEACGQDELVDFARDHLPGRKPSTLNREATRPYAAILHYAHALDWRPWIRLRAFLEAEVERPAAAAGDIALLIANADRTGTYRPHHYSHKHGPLVDRNAPYKAALLELLHVRALRLGDNLALKRDQDLDLPGARIRVRIGKARGKVKWLPLPPALVATLANLPACAGGWVFPWRTRSGVYKWLRPLRRRLGVAFTPHMARHALATEALELGVDERVIQELGAWSNRASLKPYQKVAQRLMRDVDAKRAALPAVGKPLGKPPGR